MIVTATPKQLRMHESIRHIPTKGVNHSSACGPHCLYQTGVPPKIQHGDDKGGKGKSGRRRSRGWRKGWWKVAGRKTAPAGSFNFIQAPVTRENKPTK